jgi:Protein of unknown function (DUF3016)
MHRLSLHSLSLAVTAAATAIAISLPAAAAGTVEVSFVQPDKFADIGRGQHDQRDALAAIERHFKSLGERLPQGQTLKVEVSDIDLAGEMRFTRRGDEKRILRGRADWPRMQLKYSLNQGAQTLKAGDDKLADMGYLQRISLARDHSAYAYDTRMIDDWFARTFAAEMAK